MPSKSNAAATAAGSFTSNVAFRVAAIDYPRLMRTAPEVLKEKLEQATKKWSAKMIEILVLKRLTKKGVQPPGGGLAVRSGTLRRSFDATVTELGKVGWRAVIFSDVKYAAIHEFGGTIRARKSKYLTIPLPPMLTATGVLRQSARSVPDTFVFKSKRGNLFIARTDANGKLELLFLLRTEVYIPARMGLRAMLAKEGTPLQIELVKKAIAAALRAIGKGK